MFWMTESSKDVSPVLKKVEPPKDFAEIAKVFKARVPTLNVSVETAAKIPELNDLGLETLFLCFHGLGRSPQSAEESTTDFHIPAISFAGGLGKLQFMKHISPEKYQGILTQLAKVKNVVVLLDVSEIAGEGRAFFMPKISEILAELKEKVLANGGHFYSKTDNSVLEYQKKVAARILED